MHISPSYFWKLIYFYLLPQQQVSLKRFLLANDFIAWLLWSWVIAIRTAACTLWCKVISYREMSVQKCNFSAQIMAHR